MLSHTPPAAIYYEVCRTDKEQWHLWLAITRCRHVPINSSTSLRWPLHSSLCLQSVTFLLYLPVFPSLLFYYEKLQLRQGYSVCYTISIHLRYSECWKLLHSQCGTDVTFSDLVIFCFFLIKRRFKFFRPKKECCQASECPKQLTVVLVSTNQFRYPRAGHVTTLWNTGSLFSRNGCNCHMWAQPETDAFLMLVNFFMSSVIIASVIAKQCWQILLCIMSQ